MRKEVDLFSCYPFTVRNLDRYLTIGYCRYMCNQYIWGGYSWGPAKAIGVWRPAHPFDGPQPSG
jgi:hypothetical protein